MQIINLGDSFRIQLFCKLEVLENNIIYSCRRPNISTERHLFLKISQTAISPAVFLNAWVFDTLFHKMISLFL